MEHPPFHLSGERASKVRRAKEDRIQETEDRMMRSEVRSQSLRSREDGRHRKRKRLPQKSGRRTAQEKKKIITKTPQTLARSIEQRAEG
jgi:hypothetical protein